MKILITTDCYTPIVNGVVTSILNLETELRKLDHEVKILCPSESFRCCESENVYRIGSVGVGRIYNGARAALRIRQNNLQKIINWKPDVIHSQSEFTSFIMAKRIAAEVGCPIVHTYHTVYENYTHYFSPSITLGRKAVIMMTKRILQHTAAVIAPSRKIEKLLKDYGVEQPINIIPTGLNLDKFTQPIAESEINSLKEQLGIPRESKVLITVGRTAKEKNIDELIRSYKQLNLKNAVFVIVGGGPYLATLKEIAQTENVTDKVIFTGEVSPDKIAKYYKLGDVFLSASQSESQGLTYIEALASRLPAICKKDECLEGVITDGINGGLYTDFDSFQRLIKSVLSDEEMRGRLSENAAVTAQRYSAAEFAKSAEKVYEKVVSERKQHIAQDTTSECRDCG